MIYLLVSITVILSLVIVYLILQFHQSQKAFQQKLKVFEDFMVELNSEQKKQSIQLRLSDDLKAKLKEVNAALSKNVFELNYQLMEDLYPKKEM
ncbi:hypothetical protein WMW71_08930 [Flavobacterium buctense]|uniref:Sensor histidine kinase n=1 Tax=Flavobacterium buctense TaxID=1648146 RepID=A0ABU9E1E2_9FLAO|nr:hypothetical protein [Flavobacterium buctense]